MPTGGTAVHAEGARLVRDDRHDALADVLVLEQLREDAHEGHGGRDFAVARASRIALEASAAASGC